MSQADNPGSVRSCRADASAPQQPRKRRLDWAVLVVFFALGCTLGWISLLLWGAMRAFQLALL
jgi:hypothetical protein